MSSGSDGVGSTEADADGTVRSRRSRLFSWWWRSRPAPRAHNFWRFGYPAIVVAMAVAVFLLAQAGGGAVLNREVDEVSESVVYQPDEPGYLELVGATPTLLVLHVDSGQLVGVTFMASTGVDSGGGIVLLSSDLFVAPDPANPDSGKILAAAFAEEGATAVHHLVESALGVGFDEVVELSTDDLAAAMRPAEPLPYLFVDDLVEVSSSGTARVIYTAGADRLQASDAAAVFAFRNPDEADANRLERQRALWESWIGVVNRAEDPSEVLLPFEAGLFPYLRAFAAGTTVIEVAGMQAVALDPGLPPFYVLTRDQMVQLHARVLELVPWPRSPESYWRPRVKLLDGVGDPALRYELASTVISSGGVIPVMGNAAQFGVAATQFAYHRPELVTDPIINTIAANLGLEMALIERPEGEPELSDVTVTVGLDQLQG